MASNKLNSLKTTVLYFCKKIKNIYMPFHNFFYAIIPIISLYIAVFYLAFDNYSHKKSEIESDWASIKDVLYSNTDFEVKRSVISLVPKIQNTLCSEKPKFFNPFSIIRSLFYENQRYSPNRRAIPINAIKGKLGVSFDGKVKKVTRLKQFIGTFEKFPLSWKNSNLSGAILLSSWFKGADFSGSDLTQTDFSGSNLSKAIFKQVTFSATVFRDANLSGADFSQIDQFGARPLTQKQRHMYYSKKIQDITGANILYINASADFINWAKSAGAVEMQPEAWRQKIAAQAEHYPLLD